MTMANNTATLRVELGNAAFDGDELGPELAWALVDLASRINDQSRDYLRGNGRRTRVKDSNGNTIGFLLIEATAGNECPECGSDELEDNGHTGREITYRCTSCDHRFGPGEE